jgi:nitroimidazol reductase NimA-like FMN-containing flavoprotein (pyridoxamine 5'-phosphate oxidase superfamily)
VSNYGLVVLDRGACESLLASQRVGRVALCNGHRIVLPVVYELLDGDVVFRTAPGEKLIAAALRRTMAVEIDAYDAEGHNGWSVDVIGTAEEIIHPRELSRARALDLPAYAGEARDRFVRIRTETSQAAGSRRPI